MDEGTQPAAPKPVSASTSSSSITDRRLAPRGVMPRGIQTWLMAGLAAFMVLIMLVVGRPASPDRSPETPVTAGPPSADRVRDYQDRLRALQTQSAPQAEERPQLADPTGIREPQPPAPPDPVQAERRKREYDSLFASNVVMSRRPESERPDLGRAVSLSTKSESSPSGELPTVDQIADAAIRATERAAGPSRGIPLNQAASQGRETLQLSGPVDRSEAQRAATPEQTGPIGAGGPVHPVLEGTIVDTVLTNRVDGAGPAPVNCLVTNALYSFSGRHVLIPAGARLIGETKPVQAFGETRLALAFHRLLMPDGRTYRLDDLLGLNQAGDVGLKDQANQHYLATFGASAAVGLISGLTQYVGSSGVGGGDGNRTVVIAGNVGESASQATSQVMNKFLNRLPTVTIREGHRVKVYFTSDFALPAYPMPGHPEPF